MSGNKKVPPHLQEIADSLIKAKQIEMHEQVEIIMKENPGVSQQEATNVYLLNQIIALEVGLGTLEAQIDCLLEDNETTGLN